jgi:hypothetical protein
VRLKKIREKKNWKKKVATQNRKNLLTDGQLIGGSVKIDIFSQIFLVDFFFVDFSRRFFRADFFLAEFFNDSVSASPL